ncbi:MAG: HlyC/CorC family transporter [Gemmatimonadetes bacterium]|nr:HlyC/CorC family transporter [Gemmatimonadota bacterium]MCA9767273.1 HlyC/CorC family transporter [Gemmatimonadota bacterium]MCB9517505.1 HlyC/CorC family transporter [Gemmatimonadales bacterium]HPF60867.1 hemolysin family protein [Gemmatimonadales bacterium]HRX19485.1 hemolysin family protein [Gemmatimonadales bacterium]
MKWLILLLGLALAGLGSAGTAALITTARRRLADAVSRRLRGAIETFEWFAETDRLVVTAMALVSLGVVLIGVAIPGLFDTLTLPQLGLALLVLVVPATLLGGSLLPRWLSEPRAERVVAVVRPLLRGARSVLRLVLPGGRHAVSADVQALAREGTATGLGSGEEIALVGGVMTFAERPVREVMTPRTDVVAVSETASHAEVLATFAASGYTRLPLLRGSLDEIVGMVHAFDLFKVSADDPLPVRPVAHAPETRAAADVLLDMQRERRHFAVVLDEFGGTAGIVTLEDLLEALVGEISDEDDAEVVAPAARADLLELDGAATVTEVAEHFGVALAADEATSFAGLLIERLGRIPVSGERFEIAGLDVDILRASPTHVVRFTVRRGAPDRLRLDGGPR